VGSSPTTRIMFKSGYLTPIRVLMEALEKLSPVMHTVRLDISYEAVARILHPVYGYDEFPDSPDMVRVSLEFVVPYKVAKDARFDEQKELNPGPSAIDN
jgi:hypothetical protein